MTIKTRIPMINFFFIMGCTSFLLFSFSSVELNYSKNNFGINNSQTTLIETTVILKDKLNSEEVEELLFDLTKNRLFKRVYFENSSNSLIFYNSEEESKTVKFELENYFKNKKQQIESISSKIMNDTK